MSNLKIEHILKASGGKFPRVWHPKHGVMQVVVVNSQQRTAGFKGVVIAESESKVELSLIQNLELAPFGNILLGDCKLILRPISSITEEEKKKLHDCREALDILEFFENENSWGKEREMSQRRHARYNSYLASMGFDTHGYLNAGLAITPEEAEKGGEQC